MLIYPSNIKIIAFYLVLIIWKVTHWKAKTTMVENQKKTNKVLKVEESVECIAKTCFQMKCRVAMYDFGFKF